MEPIVEKNIECYYCRIRFLLKTDLLSHYVYTRAMTYAVCKLCHEEKVNFLFP